MSLLVSFCLTEKVLSRVSLRRWNHEFFIDISLISSWQYNCEKVLCVDGDVVDKLSP